MKEMKYRITKIKREMFFLRLGAIITYNYFEDRIYSENKEEYVPLNFVNELGIEAELVKEDVKTENALRSAYIQGREDGIDASREWFNKKISTIADSLREKIIESEKCPKFERAFRQVALEEALNIVIMEMNK